MNRILIVAVVTGLIVTGGISANSLLSSMASSGVTRSATLPIPAGTSYYSMTGVLRFIINVTQNGTLIGGWSANSNVSVYVWFSPNGNFSIPPSQLKHTMNWKTNGQFDTFVKIGSRVEIIVFWKNTSIFAPHAFSITQTVMITSNN